MSEIIRNQNDDVLKSSNQKPKFTLVDEVKQHQPVNHVFVKL